MVYHKNAAMQVAETIYPWFMGGVALIFVTLFIIALVAMRKSRANELKKTAIGE